jgi:DNA (cytosine-5)-methyltransferase 1
MPEPLRVLSLFAGIGGFDLGLERTGGFKTVAFCEIDKKAQQVLRKHWPEVPIYDDVTKLTAERLAADGIAVDVICGGFPCQDISLAGRGAGIEGERSGLWSDYSRLIGELLPHYVIVENVSALLGRGLDRVLGDLAEVGYDADWHCIPASAVGAPHRRDRVWIVAYPRHRDEPERARQAGWCFEEWEAIRRELGCTGEAWGLADVADTGCQYGIRGAHVCTRNGEPYWTGLANGQEAAGSVERRSEDVADASRKRWNWSGGGTEPSGWRQPSDGREDVAYTVGERRGEAGRCQGGCGTAGCGRAVHHEWDVEPDVGRVAHGVSGRVDRLKQLGNAVVPQIPELIGRALLASQRKEAA